VSSRDPEPHLSILDVRLAEIDRRLSTIQTGLAEDEAALAAGAPGPPPDSAGGPPPGSAGGRPPGSGGPPPESAEVPEAPGPHAQPSPADPSPAQSSPPRPAAHPSSTRPAAHSASVSGLHDQKRSPGRSPDRVAGSEATQPEAGGDREINAELVDRLYELASSQQRVLESMRELLGAYEQVLRAGPGVGGPVSVSAGPFVSTDALRDFERTLKTLPQVRAVELRAFEGDDRAILDVHLV
jgi:hypothetical protein